MAPTQRIAGQRLDTLQITASTEGAVIPRVYGAMRTGGNIIWATDFREERRTTHQGGGGKGGGGGGGTEVTEYFYFASFAIALAAAMLKSAREAGVNTRWTFGDRRLEAALAAFVGRALAPQGRFPTYLRGSSRSS